MVKIAIISYSIHGHTATLAKEIQRGIEAAGGKADLYRVEETLSDEILTKMHASPRDESIPIATLDTLVKYDAFLFGVPTRFGSLPAQWTSFWDSTGGIWKEGALFGKPAGLFITTSSIGGGMETTVRNCLSYLVHHGIIYVPLGYKNTFAELSNLKETHGGSAWGAGTFTGADGSRTASDLELRIANAQGRTFYETVKKFGEKKKQTTPVKKDVNVVKETPEVKEHENSLTSCCVVM